jgi:hypothetical protein
MKKFKSFIPNRQELEKVIVNATQMEITRQYLRRLIHMVYIRGYENGMMKVYKQ